MRPSLRSTWVGAHVVLFAVLSYVAFSRNYPDLAFGVDGGVNFMAPIHQWNWAPAALGFWSDPFQGLSDLWYGDNAKLLPGYLLPALILGNPAAAPQHYVVLSYTVFALELFLSVLVLARSLGMKWFVAIIAAWVLPLLAEPYFGYSLLYPILMSAPSVGTMMAECSLLVVAISRLGRGWSGSFASRLRRNAAPGAAILLLFTLLLASYPFRAVLWFPAMAVISLALIAGAAGGERRAKLVLLAILSVAFLVSGPGWFLFGLFSFTTPQFWTGTLANTITDPVLVSIWYGHPSVGPMGPMLFGAGVFGMVLALIWGDRRLRWCALGALFFVGSILAFGYFALVVQAWRGPAPLYFEFLLWPFYAIFAVWGVSAAATGLAVLLRQLAVRALGGAGAAAGERGSSLQLPASVATTAALFLSMVVPAFAIAGVWAYHAPKRIYPFPPTVPPIIETLRDRLALAPGAPFRGRVLDMQLLDRANPVGWLELAGRIGARYAATGNDYDDLGLWSYGVPTLFEYSPATSPAYFRLVTRLLARPNDPQMRNVVVLRQPDAHALALLGVRYLIANVALPAPFRLVMREHTYGKEVLSLYEVPGVNLGRTAPTEVKVAKGFEDALTELADPGFDAEHSVVVFDPALAKASLRPVDAAEVKMIPGGFSVEAKSAGRSLLVLPFEFSRCLRLESRAAGGGEAPRLVRVDALETGVLFSDQLAVDIRYFTGLFQNSLCRVGDASDFSRLLSRE